MASRSFREEARRICGSDPGRPWLTLLGADLTPTVVSRGQLGARINEYGAYYRQAGLVPGDTVLIVLRESVDLVAAFFAALAYGAVPAYYAYPSPKQSVAAFTESLRHLVSYNAVRLLVSYDEVIGLVEQDRTLAGHGWQIVAAETVRCPSAPAFGDRPASASEAFLQFSSGTTGAKKGVRISAAALFNQLDAYTPLLALEDTSVVVTWLPHYHDMGLVACLLLPFLREVPVVMMSPFAWVKDPALLLRAIRAHRGTHVWLPNFALGHLVRAVDGTDLSGYDLGSIRKLVLCSEPVLADTVQAFLATFGACGLGATRLESCYAMAENTFAMTSTDGTGLTPIEIDPEVFRREHRASVQPGGRRLMSAGRPLPNLSLRLVDEAGQPVGEATVGEVLIQSNCMLDGYHHNPEATAAALDQGWFKTGDLGFLHAGELFITGRKKDVIIVAGENIYPQDVESLLNEDPALIPGRNVVFGVADDRVGTERLVVLAEVADPGAPPDELGVRTRITAALNVAVGEVCFLPHMTLRKGTAGKISRSVNKQAYLEGVWTARPAAPSVGASPIRRLVEATVPPSRRTALHEDTPLLTSGLIDSLAFVDLVRRLEAACGLEIPAARRTVEHFDTIARIAQTVETLRAGGPSARSTVAPDVTAPRAASLDRLKRPPASADTRAPMAEWWINHSPLRGSAWYAWLLRRAGIRVGTGVKFLGRVTVKLRGRPENIVIGDGVILGDGVDLRNRENGRLVLRDRVYLDKHVRLTAARDGAIDIGFGSEIGAGSIINSGGETRIGEFCLIAGGVNINASRHGTAREAYVKEQPHTHGQVEIGNDVWIGSGASIVIDTRIGEGAIIGSNSLVHGDVPAFAICAGVPAQVVRYR